jgi:predicted DNA-binding WGR domain protein
MHTKCFDEWQCSKLQIVFGYYLFCYRYWLFRSWGRIGTTIGGNKLENKDSLQEAVYHFEALYEEKTGNMWSNRKHFKKFPGRFFPVDLDYSQVSLYCICIWWFADSCNRESGRCRNTIFKKINASSDHVMTFGMLWSLIFLAGIAGYAVALDTTLNFMGN